MRQQFIVNAFSSSTLNLNWQLINYFGNLNKVAYLTLLLNEYAQKYWVNCPEKDSIIFPHKKMKEHLPLSESQIKKIKKELITDKFIYVKMSGSPAKEHLFLNLKKISDILTWRI